MARGALPIVVSYISVIIPTHNPRLDYLKEVLEALRGQTLPMNQWELLVVDNGSKQFLHADNFLGEEGAIDLNWHPSSKVIREDRLGLTYARLCGFSEAAGELIILVDDDNVLSPNYLECALGIARRMPQLGAFGGKCLPCYEVEPEPWLLSQNKGLGLRNLGDEEQIFPKIEESAGLQNEDFEGRRLTESGEQAVVSIKSEQTREFPDCAPIGAGMVMRREAAISYVELLRAREDRSGRSAAITDRRGNSLSSGGDNDICLTAVENGWQVGYFPQLYLTHLISRHRMTLQYQRRMARDSMKSYILMLDQHGIRPWAPVPYWSVPLRIAKDCLRVKPWKGAAQSLRWWNNIGMYEGRAAIG